MRSAKIGYVTVALAESRGVVAIAKTALCLAMLAISCSATAEPGDIPPSNHVSASEFVFYSCVNHYMRANAVPKFDSSINYAIEFLDGGFELISELSDYAKTAAGKLPAPDYTDPEHGAPAVLAFCKAQSESIEVREIATRHQASQ